MTIQTNPIEEINKEISNEFTMRTMQDDLANFNSAPNNESIIGNHNINSIQAPIQSNKPSPSQSPFENIQAKKIPTMPIVATASINISKEADLPKKPNGKITYKVIFTVIALGIIAILSAGFYYFYTLNQPAQTTTPPPIAITPEPQKDNLPTERYFTEKPNLLTLDFSTTPSEEIRNKFKTITADLKNLPAEKPAAYEFMLVDSNNSPITLQAFLEATNLSFPPATSTALGDVFSLFFYNDNGDIHLALEIKITNQTVLSSALLKQESTLPSDLVFLFLDASIEKTQTIFNVNTTTYPVPVRYAILNNTGTLSLDYMVTKNSLILATSRETMKQVFLKLNPPTATTENSTSLEAPTTPTN